MDELNLFIDYHTKCIVSIIFGSFWYRQDKRMDELNLFIDYHTKCIVSIIFGFSLLVDVSCVTTQN